MLRWLTGLTNSGPQRKADRQRAQRIAQYFDCTWMSQWGAQRARVSALSSSGCYIESRTVPVAGADVRDITVMLPSGTITLQGTAVDATPGIGFGVRFTDLDGAALAHLVDLVQQLAPPQPQRRL
jgi:hypothetical protein